jgi:hypothetical protein
MVTRLNPSMMSLETAAELARRILVEVSVVHQRCV